MHAHEVVGWKHKKRVVCCPNAGFFCVCDNMDSDDSSVHAAYYYSVVDEAESWTSEWPFPTYNVSSSETETASGAASNLHRPLHGVAGAPSTGDKIIRRPSATPVIAAPVTAIEVGSLRSLFGRGDSSGVNDVSRSTAVLLPHVDLRWFFRSAAHHSPSHHQQRRCGDVQINDECSDAHLAPPVLRRGTRTCDEGDEDSSDEENGHVHPAHHRPGQQQRRREVAGISPPRGLKTIANLFQNIEARSVNWTAITLRDSDVLIDSPRSAVALLRSNVDLKALAQQIFAAHASKSADRRSDSTTRQRIRGNNDHQELARQLRQRIEVQSVAAAALGRLRECYAAICESTSPSEVESMREAEHARRTVVVHKSASRVADRSASTLSRSRDLDRTALATSVQGVSRKHSMIADAATRRAESMQARARRAAEHASHRQALTLSQARRSVLSDIQKRESALLRVHRAQNVDKVIDVPPPRRV